MEHPTGGTMLSHCPACGQRLTCPRCGSTLRSAEGETARLECTSCHLDLGEAVTLPQNTVEPVDAMLAGRLPGFELRGEIGRGGMGIVYRAHQRSLRRDVAIKVLPPVMAGNLAALERFRNEATVAARLVDAHILPVFDVQEVQGIPLIVMPFIEGCDLGRIIRDRAARHRGQDGTAPHPWTLLDDLAYLEHMLSLLDQTIAAVTALHRGGVLHRDIKPSNVLVDDKGGVWLSDFGLARLEEQGAGTLIGQGIGTAAYSSPEQARGAAELDFRADLFSLGVTLYQALTLELPFSKYGAEGTQITPARPSVRQPLLPRDFDPVVLKAIQRDRDKRYASVAELEADWLRARRGQLPQAGEAGPVQRLARGLRRYPGRVLMAACLIGLVGALAWVSRPNDPTDYRKVRMETDPPGATLVLVPLDAQTGVPVPEHAIRPRQPSPVLIPRVPVGSYVVVAVLADGRFQEVYRMVPPAHQTGSVHFHQAWQEEADGVVKPWPITIPQGNLNAGMVLFAGGQFVAGGGNIPGSPPYEHYVAPFYLDPTEVTVGQWRKLRRLPEPLREKPPPDDFAITHVTFDEALDFAESLGKRIPEEDEYEYAATNAGTTRFPWGNDDRIHDWPRERVGEPDFDRTRTTPPVFGLFSNVAEWTASWNVPYPTADADFRKNFYLNMQTVFQADRVVRGGPYEVVVGKTNVKSELGKPPLDPRYRHGVTHSLSHEGLGFRCARSAQPRFQQP
jgi:formylglycine-generating enzyme required for sulfatase activity